MTRFATLVSLALAGCGSSTLSGPCSLDSPCSDGEICDYTAEGGAICISTDGDVDGDGLPNGKDFCQHQEGGANDEDGDGTGDECDSCPVAAPRATPDPDGDKVESPCDPAPTEPGDEILFFDGFNGALSADWKAMTPAAWTAGDGEVTANLSAVATEDSLSRVVPGKTNVAVEIGYKVDRVENSSPRHLVAVYADDPRPAGTATVQCGVSRADSAAGDLVFVQTNSGQMSSMTVDPALLTTKSYRASAYMSGARAGCVVIANNMALGTVQTTITPDDLSTIALNAQSVTARFQYVLVVGH